MKKLFLMMAMLFAINVASATPTQVYYDDIKKMTINYDFQIDYRNFRNDTQIDFDRFKEVKVFTEIMCEQIRNLSDSTIINKQKMLDTIINVNLAKVRPYLNSFEYRSYCRTLNDEMNRTNLSYILYYGNIEKLN